MIRKLKIIIKRMVIKFDINIKCQGMVLKNNIKVSILNTLQLKEYDQI